MGEIARLQKQVGQLRVQLAGCLTAAEGGTSDPAKQSDYGWSLAYQRTLDLRLKYDAMEKRLAVKQAAMERCDEDESRCCDERLTGGHNPGCCWKEALDA